MSPAAFDLRTSSLAPGTVLLEASAGTGKTYTLIGVLLRLLVEGQLERLDQALVVTFTVAATEELKTRLRGGLQRALRAVHAVDEDPFYAELARHPDAETKLRAAIDDFDAVVVSTIHGFCKRVLEEAAFESHEPFQVEFTADPVPLLYAAAADALRSQYDATPTLRAALLHATKITPETLVKSYQLWRQKADLPMTPAVPDPQAALDALAAALAETAAAFDDEVARRLGLLQWNKGKSLFASVDEVMAFAGRVRSNPTLVLDLLRQCAYTPLRKRITVKVSGHHLGHPFFRTAETLAEAFDDAHEHLRAHLLLAMHRRVDEHKQRHATLSFDDLLVRTHRALRDTTRGPALIASLQQKYRAALIDEFQDTDALQYDLFATAFAGRTLFLIGDPKQSIYGFRGADLRTYLAARAHATRTHTLLVNHRSSAAMVDATGFLFARAFAFVDPGITMPQVKARAQAGELQIVGDDGPALRFRWIDEPGGDWLAKAEAEERITLDVAAEITRLLRRGVTLDDEPLQPSHVAVLTRTNRQAVLVQEALRAAGVPSAIGKAGDIFQTEELVDVQRFLHAVLHPGDLRRVRAAMATRWWGLDSGQLAALHDDDHGLDDAIERLDHWRRLWLRSGFTPMVERAWHDLQVARRLLAQPGGERRLTNFRQLFELLHDAEHDGRLSPEGLVEWLQHERAHQEDLDYTLRELRLESDGDAVQILTVHGAKGLEYEIVFCPFLWDARAPSPQEIVTDGDGTQRLVFDLLTNHPQFPRAVYDRLAEDLRLAYVALTRAKRRCYVHWGPIGDRGNAWRSALAWLLDARPTAIGTDAEGKPLVAQVDAALRRTKEEFQQWGSTLLSHAMRSNNLFDVQLVPEHPQATRFQAPPPTDLHSPRRAVHKPRVHGLHSFTSIVAGAPPLEPLADVVDPATATETPAKAQGIFAFARGAAAGQCLHDILEHVDLRALDAPATRERVHDTLAAHGLIEPGAHSGELDPVPTVLQNLRDLAGARLHGATLGDVCSGVRSAEWEFVLPLPAGGLPALADCLAARDDAACRAQAERLRHLPPQTLRGHLTGFVDLVAEHDGRYFVFDWKSNHLGVSTADYGPDALREAMVHHDYVLQYHLYVVALHRHLRVRLPDYDPERHLGSVCYVFLRGLQAGTAQGLFVDRVPTATVHALDRWLGAHAESDA